MSCQGGAVTGTRTYHKVFVTKTGLPRMSVHLPGQSLVYYFKSFSVKTSVGVTPNFNFEGFREVDTQLW